MKKVYLVHGWEGHSENFWFPWLKEELEKKDFSVISFDMPNTSVPKIEEWVSHIAENIDSVDEKTYFVGHSVGCQAIMRFMEKLHKHVKIGGCVFVAPWLNLIGLSLEELNIAHPWINNKINFERILDHCGKFQIIFSSDDPYVHMSEIEKFEEGLHVNAIVKHGCGHFSNKKNIFEILEFVK